MFEGLKISLTAVLFVVLVLGIAETTARVGKVAPSVTRRIVHVVVGIAAGLLPMWFVSPVPFYPVAALALCVTAFDSRRGRIKSVHGIQRKSYGTATFALAFILAGLLCWTLRPDRTWVFSAAMLVLAIADPFAATIGGRRQAQTDIRSQKSSLGSAAFFGAACVVVAIVLLTGDGPAPPSTLFLVLTILLCGSVAAVAERVSRGGFDNVAIVLAVCGVLHLAYEPATTVITLAVAVTLPATFAYAAFRARLLTGAGAVVAGLLSVTVILMWDWQWIWPGLLFFVTASGMSRIGRTRKRDYEQCLNKGAVRDPAQVLANGGAPWLMLMGAAFLPSEYWFWGFAGAFAAATADTWGTELGMLSQSPPRDLKTWRTVRPGTSGAVSAMGTSAALFGALLIAGSAVPFLSTQSQNPGWAVFIVACAGVTGALVDTMLGAWLQAQYADATGRRTEVSNGNRLVRGWKWLDNDAVNFVSSLTGGVVAVSMAIGILG